MGVSGRVTDRVSSLIYTYLYTTHLPSLPKKPTGTEESTLMYYVSSDRENHRNKKPSPYFFSVHATTRTDYSKGSTSPVSRLRRGV